MDIFKKFLEDLKKKDFKKYVPYIVAFLIFGILMIRMTSKLNPNSDNINSVTDNLLSKASDNTDTISVYAKSLEDRLENILSQFDGVGNVEVFVAVKETIEKVPAINITKSTEQTTEEDSSGGTRETTREDISEEIVKSNEEMIIINKIIPEIKGVIVVAKGVEDVTIKEKLYTAVKTALGLPGHKVEIFIGK